MSENIPITFAWRRQLQEADWPERKRKSVMAVAFILEDYADPDGQNVYPANDTIAFKAGMNIKTVRDVLRLMTENRFLRRVGKARYGQSKYRLIYPALPVETYLQRPTNSEKSKTPTNRTELPTDDDSSPDGDIVASSANTERSISVPIIEGDLVVLERCKDHQASAQSDLHKLTARAKSIVTKSQAQMDAENHRIETDVDQILWVSIEGTHLFSNIYPAWDHIEREIKQIFDLVYNDCDLFSHVCATIQYFDKREWEFRASLMGKHRMLGADLKSTHHFLTTTARRAFETLTDATMRYRQRENLPNHEIAATQDLECLTVVQIRDEFYQVRNQLQKDIEKAWISFSNAGSVSVSATNTGSDPMIVQKIVETVSEKVDEKDVERW